MTEQKFLNGTKFSLSKDTSTNVYYKVQHADYLMKVYRTKEGIVLFEEHHANIKSVTKEGFTGYSSLLNESFEVKLLFEDLVGVE